VTGLSVNIAPTASNALVEIYLGASVDSFGNGAWVVSLTASESREEISGVDSLTTPDRIALIAAIEGLNALKRRSAVEVYTTSPNLVQGAVKWLPRWKSVMAGKRADGRDRIRNHDRWDQLHAVASLHDIQWHYVDPVSAKKSGVVGRTAGEGPDVGHLHFGAVPHWDKALGPYRAFTKDEMGDESVCYRIDDDQAPITHTPKLAARIAVIARAVQQKQITSRRNEQRN
jgi:ribonuclease HI